MKLEEMLKLALELNASDLHLSSGDVPMLRIDGDLMPIKDAEPLSNEVVKSIVDEVLPDRHKKVFRNELEVDCAYAQDNVARFRVNAFHQARGASIVFRVIPGEIPSLDSLNLPPVLRKLCHLPSGLVLVTGPTGSGKSTTLAAMLDYINENEHLHIITLEDPIEFSHKDKQCLVQQREVGLHTLGFEKALRSALREDPDVILVGEMRDIETIRLALTAAETGHLVFATLHTSSAAKTINRIIDVFPAAEKSMVRSMLSESLQAVVAQILLKKVGGGRVAAHEVLLCTPAVRNLIREDKVPQILSAIQTGQALGMCALEQGIEKLVKAGTVDREEVAEYLKRLE